MRRPARRNVLRSGASGQPDADQQDRDRERDVAEPCDTLRSARRRGAAAWRCRSGRSPTLALRTLRRDLRVVACDARRRSTFVTAPGSSVTRPLPVGEDRLVARSRSRPRTRRRTSGRRPPRLIAAVSFALSTFGPRWAWSELRISRASVSCTVGVASSACVAPRVAAGSKIVRSAVHELYATDAARNPIVMSTRATVLGVTADVVGGRASGLESHNCDRRAPAGARARQPACRGDRLGGRDRAVGSRYRPRTPPGPDRRRRAQVVVELVHERPRRSAG